MRAERPSDSGITQQASDWFLRLPRAAADEQAAFGAWLKESPKHIEEFLLVSAVYRELDHVPAGAAVDLESLRAELQAGVIPLARQTPIVTANQLPSGRSRRSRFILAWAAAALGVVVTSGYLLYASFLKVETYTTATGEIRSLELKDGSLIQLNTHSQVKVNFSAGAREIQLVSGEAAFKVARDLTRPFRVHAGNAVIQAIGTEFNVYRRTHDTAVSVLEGSVRVSDDTATSKKISVPEAPADEGAPMSTQVLTIGQEVHIPSNGKISRPQKSDLAKATAWRQRRIVFRGDSLADVATEFNRYNRTPQIRVDGDIARGKPIAGIFDANDPESLIQFLAGVDDLKTERKGDEVVISRRQPHE